MRLVLPMAHDYSVHRCKNTRYLKTSIPRSGAATNPSPHGASAMTPVLCPENRRCAVDADVRLGGWWVKALLLFFGSKSSEQKTLARLGAVA